MSDGDSDPTGEAGTTEADAPADARGSPEASGESETVDSDANRDGSDDAAYAVPTDTDSEDETAWRRELAETGELTPNAVDTVIRLHDGRGARAIEAVSEGRVKRYRDFTVVVGHDDEYVVEAGGCTCKDSSYNLDPDDPHERCWHVLSVAVAERIGEVDHHEMWYSEVRDFL